MKKNLFKNCFLPGHLFHSFSITLFQSIFFLQPYNIRFGILQGTAQKLDMSSLFLKKKDIYSYSWIFVSTFQFSTEYLSTTKFSTDCVLFFKLLQKLFGVQNEQIDDIQSSYFGLNEEIVLRSHQKQSKNVGPSDFTGQ